VLETYLQLPFVYKTAAARNADALATEPSRSMTNWGVVGMTAVRYRQGERSVAER